MKQYVLPLLTCIMTLAFSTCFRPSVKCTPCSNFCAGGLTCRNGLCVENPGDTCTSGDAAADSGAVVEVAPEVPTPDADNASDASDSTTDVAANQCIDRCCIGASCLDLVPRVRQGLLLWADRTSMGQPESALERWQDRSPNAYHLKPFNLDTPPRVRSDLVGPIAEISESRMVLATQEGSSLRLGVEDFTILALVRCDAGYDKAIVFQKRNSDRPRSGIAMFCNHDGNPLLIGASVAPNRVFLSMADEDHITGANEGMIVSQRTDLGNRVHLLAARRVDGTRLQLRIDGALEGETTIMGSVNLADDFPLFVGSVASPTPPYISNFRGGLAAVVVVRGPLTDEELEALEAFLIRTGSEGAPRLQ